MKLPAYPKYKPSGVEWLGDVPEHWGVKRLRYLTAIRKGRLPGETFTSPTADSDLPYLSMDFLRGETDCPNYVAATTDLVLAEDGDLLLLWDGSNAGEFLTAKKGVVSSTVARLETRCVERSFLAYACKALEPQIKDQTVGMGIPHVSGDELKSCSLPYPESAEQQGIATFLNLETGRMDRLVAKKQMLIKRLKEKRTALISRTVTCGLPPAAARTADLPENLHFKTSGLDWLGDIPKHWDVGPLKSFAKDGRKTFTDGDWVELPFITDEGVRLIQTGNVGIGTYKEQGFRYVTEASFSELGCTEVMPNDVLICRLDGPVGRACLAPNLGVRMITSVDNTILKARSNVSPKFLIYLLSSVPWLSWIDALCRVGGGFRMRISRTMLGNIRVPIPPFLEQAAIAKYLDAETAKLDALVSKMETAVERLQEYRTALITAAVTGKIDVRKESHGK
jgi:type I restriction enzyme S subunit